MIKIATIAGSDASGGAGIEADLKTFEEYGIYGMAAVTLIATMDPDNNWTHKVYPIEEEALRSQFETVFKGVGAAAVKTGMLGTFYAVELAREYIEKFKITKYVLDPVMVCKGAGEALNPELNSEVEKKLLPLAEVITPNLFEAEQLSGLSNLTKIKEVKEAARIIHGKGARNVFIKGGAKLKEGAKSKPAVALDLFFDGDDFEILEADLKDTAWTHGAGCTVSAAVASGLAIGLSVWEAVVQSKKFITKSLNAGFALNQWVGPGNPSDWRKETLFGN